MIFHYTWPCGRPARKCACNTVPLCAVAVFADPAEEVRYKAARELAMAPPWRPPPGPVVPAYTRLAVVVRPAYHARSNPMG